MSCQRENVHMNSQGWSVSRDYDGWYILVVRAKGIGDRRKNGITTKQFVSWFERPRHNLCSFQLLRSWYSWVFRPLSAWWTLVCCWIILQFMAACQLEAVALQDIFLLNPLEDALTFIWPICSTSRIASNVVNDRLSFSVCSELLLEVLS